MARSLGANGRPTGLLARASLLGLVAGEAIACQGDGSVEAARAEIRGGSPPDVELNEDGVVDLTDPAQWARDASVKLFNGETGCSGTLVSPRVVLTAAHCV